MTTTEIRCRMDIEALRLAWRPASAGERLVVGTSIPEGGTYSFRYDGADLEKAVQLGFQGYPGMPVDRTTIWNGRSMEAFRVRLPQPKRPDREHLLGLWGVAPDESDPRAVRLEFQGQLVGYIRKVLSGSTLRAREAGLELACTLARATTGAGPDEVVVEVCFL